MENNLTLLVDGNWLLMSRIFVISNKFAKKLPEQVLEANQQELHEMLARSISLMLNRNPVIDNIILIADGGSWRKELPIPKQLQDITYKGNRGTREELNWDYIYTAFEDFLEHARSIGITVSRAHNIEGDDWMWYWSRRLNENHINTIIWTSDCDLKQLVQVHNQAFTAWYNDKSGLVLPQECAIPDDPLDFFMNPPFNNNILQYLTTKYPVSYINPDEIAINKVLCGDAGDNIKSVIRYKKNNRTFRFAQKDYEKLIKETKINTMDKLLKNYLEVAKNITSNKKFQKYHFKTEDIEEMLDYNTKLVWLDEHVIPSTIITQMAAEEYKQFNVGDIRLNYRTLMLTEPDIFDIFADAK